MTDPSAARKPRADCPCPPGGNAAFLAALTTFDDLTPWLKYHELWYRVERMENSHSSAFTVYDVRVYSVNAARIYSCIGTNYLSALDAARAAAADFATLADRMYEEMSAVAADLSSGVPTSADDTHEARVARATELLQLRQWLRGVGGVWKWLYGYDPERKCWVATAQVSCRFNGRPLLFIREGVDTLEACRAACLELAREMDKDAPTITQLPPPPLADAAPAEAEQGKAAKANTEALFIISNRQSLTPESLRKYYEFNGERCAPACPPQPSEEAVAAVTEAVESLLKTAGYKGPIPYGPGRRACDDYVKARATFEKWLVSIGGRIGHEMYNPEPAPGGRHWFVNLIWGETADGERGFTGQGESWGEATRNAANLLVRYRRSRTQGATGDWRTLPQLIAWLRGVGGSYDNARYEPAPPDGNKWEVTLGWGVTSESQRTFVGRGPEWTNAAREAAAALDVYRQSAPCQSCDAASSPPAAESAASTPFDPIRKAAHYNQGKYEVIAVIEDWGLSDSFCLGNVIKYVARHRHKGGVESLRKAAYYLNREIANLDAVTEAAAKESRS